MPARATRGAWPGRVLLLLTAVLLLAGACGGRSAGSSTPVGFVECAYDAVTGEGDPGNDPACATSVPADPSAGIVEPTPGG